MATSSYNPSLGLESLLSGEIASDSERFLLFIKAYYEWLQSCKIDVSDVTGTFQRGETIVGTDGAKGVITEVGTGYLIIKVTGTRPANQSETFTGQTSGATATATRIKDNVVRKSGNLLDYRTIDNSIDDYVAYLRDELYSSIPLDFYGDKRVIANKFKSFFQSKSNEDSYRFLFRLLFNEEIDFYYPGEDLLRVSDGNYEKTQIIRVTAAAYGIDALGDPYERNVFDFLNKTIEGQTSGFLANVVDIKKFFIGSIEVAEFTLKLVSGAFVGGETITATDDEDLNATAYGIVSGFTIVDGGSGYALGDEITISGDGVSAEARVSSIKESPISALSIDATGYGYRLNTLATIDNTGTGGSGLIIKVTGIDKTYTVTSGNNSYTVGEISQVSVISRGENYFKTPSITLQDTTIASLGLLTPNLITIANTGTNYGVGNSLIFTGGAGANAAGIVAAVEETTTYDFLFEDGQRMIVDGSYEDILKNEDWNVLGPIARVELTNFGTGYTNASLPTITVNTTTGSGANLIATGIQGTSADISVDVANNIAGIGSIRALEITNFGINYTTATANASATGDGNANLTPIISGLATREGTWIDDDGKIDYKYIQDSYFYQDFSYVIKSGLGFEFYRETLKKIIHPAGLQLFGEILIRDVIDVTPDIVTDVEVLRNFERVLVQILSILTVGAQFEYSNISWTIKVESPTIDVTSPLLNKQEYVIHLVPEGDDVTGITDNTIANIREIIIQVPSQLDVTSTSASLPATKFVVSYNNTFGAYSVTYGELPLGATGGVYEDYFGEATIESLSSITFDTIYYENPPYQSQYTLTDKVPVVVDVSAQFDREFVPIISPLGLLSPVIEMIVSASSVQPQKYQAAENIISLFGVKLQDLTVLEVAGATIEDLLAQSVYSGTSETIANSTFETYYRNFQTSSQEYHKILVNVNTDASTISVGKEIIVREEGSGFRYRTLQEGVLSDYGSTALSTYSSSRFEEYLDTIPWNTIPVSPSPLPDGQAVSGPQPQDIFRGEIVVTRKTTTQAYDTTYESLTLSLLDDVAISSEIPGTGGLLYQDAVFGEYYPQSPVTVGDYVKYGKIDGLVTSGADAYSSLTLEDYQETPIELVDSTKMESTASIVSGAGTDFPTDYNPQDVFEANNEYFRVEAIANTTYMVVDRHPATSYSNAFAYKVII